MGAWTCWSITTVFSTDLLMASFLLPPHVYHTIIYHHYLFNGRKFHFKERSLYVTDDSFHGIVLRHNSAQSGSIGLQQSRIRIAYQWPDDIRESMLNWWSLQVVHFSKHFTQIIIDIYFMLKGAIVCSSQNLKPWVGKNKIEITFTLGPHNLKTTTNAAVPKFQIVFTRYWRNQKLTKTSNLSISMQFVRQGGLIMTTKHYLGLNNPSISLQKQWKVSHPHYLFSAHTTLSAKRTG